MLSMGLDVFFFI